MNENADLEARIDQLEHTLRLVIAATADVAAAVGPSAAKDAAATLHRARTVLADLR